MKYAAVLSALAAATLVSAQAPEGCSSDYSGTFEYNPVPVSGASKRGLTPLHEVNQFHFPSNHPLTMLTSLSATSRNLHLRALQHPQRRRPHRPMSAHRWNRRQLPIPIRSKNTKQRPQHCRFFHLQQRHPRYCRKRYFLPLLERQLLQPLWWKPWRSVLPGILGDYPMYCSGRCRLRLPIRHALCLLFGHFVVFHFEYAGHVGYFQHFQPSRCGHLCSSHLRRSPCRGGCCLHSLNAIRPGVEQYHHIRHRYRYTCCSDRN